MKYTPKYKIKSVKFTHNGKDYDVEGSKVLSGIYQYAKGGKLADYTYIPKNRVKEFLTKDGSVKKHSNGVWVLSSVLKTAPTKKAKKPVAKTTKTSKKPMTKSGGLIPPSEKYKGKKNMPVKAFEVAEEMVAMKKAKAKISSIRSKTNLLDIELTENKDFKEWHEPLAYTVLWYNANMPLNLAFEILGRQEYYGEGVIKAFKEEFKKAPDVTGRVSKIKTGNFMSNSAEQKLSKSFAGLDDLRPTLSKIYIDNGYAVSTDAFVMLGIYDKTLLGKEEYFDTKYDLKYPNWRGVLPNTYTTTTKKINAQRLYDFLLKAKKYNAYDPTVKGIVIKINDDNNFGFNINFITQSLKAIMSLGEDVYVHYQDMVTNRAVIFTNIENWDLDKENSSFALTMPIMVDRTYSDYISYDLDGDTVFAKGGEINLIDRNTKEKLTIADIKDIIKKQYDSDGITFSEQHIESWSPMDRNKNDYIVFPSDFKYRQGFDLGYNSNTDSSTKEQRDYMEKVLSDLKKYVKELNSTLDKESLTHKYFDESLYFAKGGEIDLFEDYEKQPKELAEIVEVYEERYADGDMDYESTKEFLDKVNAIGYTFDYGLDNEPYDLRKMAKGGKVSDFDKLANKVAKQYKGKKVPSKYQSEYGKMYSPEEAQEVGRKVAYKVKMMQEGKKMAKGGDVDYRYKLTNDVLEDIIEEFGSNVQNVQYSKLDSYTRVYGQKKVLEVVKNRLKDVYNIRSEFEPKGKRIGLHILRVPSQVIEYAKGGRTISIVNDGVKFDKSKYKAVYGDFDKDGTVNIDDANPLDSKKRGKVEQVELKNTFDKLLSVKAELDDIMYDAVDTLDKKAPKDADIYARTKTPYSILKKLVEKRMLDPQKGLTDMIGTTIAVGNQKELEQVRDDIDGGLLGKVLDKDDYYKSPKAGYRAYHYIVEYDGVPVEVQLKTKRMKKLNEVSHDFYKKGTLDAKGLDAVSKTFEKADRGDKKALTEVKRLLSNKKALASKISTSKMAKGGAIKELRKEKDIDIYEDVMEMGGDVTDSQDLTIANSDNLVMKKGGKTKKRKTGTKKPNSFFAVVKRKQKQGESWKDAIQRVKKEMDKNK